MGCYPQRCGRSLTEPLGRPKVSPYRGRPSGVRGPFARIAPISSTPTRKRTNRKGVFYAQTGPRAISVFGKILARVELSSVGRAFAFALLVRFPRLDGAGHYRHLAGVARAICRSDGGLAPFGRSGPGERGARGPPTRPQGGSMVRFGRLGPSPSNRLVPCLNE